MLQIEIIRLELATVAISVRLLVADLRVLIDLSHWDGIVAVAANYLLVIDVDWQHKLWLAQSIDPCHYRIILVVNLSVSLHMRAVRRL